MYTESEHTNLTQEELSDLAGDSMMLSARESPTESPFRLDAIICTSTANGELIKQQYSGGKQKCHSAQFHKNSKLFENRESM